MGETEKHGWSVPSQGVVSASTELIPGVRIRPFGWDDERQAARVLAYAFANDPLVVAICPGPEADRVRRIWWSFRVAVRGHCQIEQPAWCIADAHGAVRAVVLVNPPRTRVVVPKDLLFALRGWLGLGLAAGLRGIEAANMIAAHEPPQPFTYLRTLGVHPAWQRHGLGSALVAAVVRSADRSLPIYLETSRAENLAFYARHGFERSGTFRCLGVPVWRLLRNSEAPVGGTRMANP